VARVQTLVWSCGISWWAKVALGQVFSENFGFPCQSTFHLLLHNHHLHYHPRLAQWARSGRSANSLTKPNKKNGSENNISMDMKETGCWGVDCIHVAQDSDQWRDFISMLMNLRGFIKEATSLDYFID
jgi:hypothetical protein